MTCEFTLTHYFDTLDRYKDAGYNVGPVSSFKNGNPKSLLLRHDIDLSLSYAKFFSMQEYANDHVGTYYIYLNSEFYNALHPKSMDYIKQIAIHHEIGLHIDTRYYDNNQFNILTNIVGKAVTQFSQHYPGGNKTPPLNEYLSNVYRNAYFPCMKMGYLHLSDSSMRWKKGCFCQHIDKEDKICISVHPEWWITGHQNKYLVLNHLGIVIAHQIGESLKEYQDLLKSEDATRY